MNIPESLLQYISKSNWGSVVGVKSLHGGGINSVYLLETELGPKSVLKTNSKCPEHMFTRESEGLYALSAVDGGLRVPEVYNHGGDWILMEYIPHSIPATNYSSLLGEGIAQMHLTVEASFGYPENNFIGSTVQVNTWTEDGHVFFAEHRLLFQGDMARAKGLLSQEDYKLLNRIARRLNDFVPSQPASLIHGDLWSGNIIVGPGGVPTIIDPATHFGWAEADLAMTSLFGQLDSEVYIAYEGIRPLIPGYLDRIDIYNLYHLLNHLNIFGESYLSHVQTLLRKYG
ncbi:MAG: fructosamine kinase family protein [Anaerolineaceae bacterium]|nr:fructosamine kinase family protein [Anaerolineaceae bacterium]